MSSRFLRSLAVALCAALAIFALATQRALSRGAREMAASDAAFDAGELEVAIRHARRAASLYVPDAEHVALGYERLRAVALGAERARDTQLALAAWRAVRGAAIESRHLWNPHPAELARANHNLARLSDVPSEALELTAYPAAPVRNVMQSLGLAGMLAGLLLISRRGMSRGGELSWARARAPALFFAAGVVSLGLALFRV